MKNFHYSTKDEQKKVDDLNVYAYELRRKGIFIFRIIIAFLILQIILSFLTLRDKFKCN